MSIYYSPTWTNIPDNLSISQLMQHGIGKIDSDKIIYEEAITGRTVTYMLFHRQIRQTAYNMRHELLLQAGDTVLISASSCIDYILTAHAVWWAGGVVSAINNSSHPDEISHALNLVKPKFLVVDNTVHEKLSVTLKKPEYARSLTGLKVFNIGSGNSAGWPQLLLSTSSSSDGLEIHNPIRDHDFNPKKCCAAILLSSGTTGASKAVMLSHYNLIATCFQLRCDNPANWRGSQREIFFPPLSHVYATYVCFTMNLWLGAYVCLMPRFDLKLYCRLLSERSATLARIVPAVAKMLAESPIVGEYKYPNLEYFSCSAAPLHEETAAKLRKAFPGVALCQTYGCTELSGPCVQSGVRDRGLPLSASGTVITNCEIRFVDSTGNDVGARGPGEILCRAPNAMMGYKDNLEETENTISQDGWLHTGDLGYLDENGYLYIYDRLKEMIKYKGFQVAPSELENIIIQHPHVKEAAVIGVWSSSEDTEIPRAFVSLEEADPQNLEIVAKEITDFVSEKVASYKRLRGGVVVLEELPRNATGKLLKKKLKELTVQSLHPREAIVAKL
ncbi:hypothetical protein N7462_000344 [Penicillium macrosclerotiorum]|uniref:uncharacterized protein n=1 Tax=Penicillium macrosclerotiorum TaxID=303699 RepID=UPI0025471527|nr:uncharacterized protein N7462_000344 [Penicillium macrosclerotiorum]KAJ5698339.1 hypothetical protein N7462_000344 [Penicillium macrosclerotiorum]